jgi:hypothetical protein
VGGQYSTGLDVSNVLKATEVNTKRSSGNSTTQNLLVKSEQTISPPSGPQINRVSTWPINFPVLSYSSPWKGPDGDLNNATHQFTGATLKSSAEDVNSVGDWYLNTATWEYTFGLEVSETASGANLLWVNYQVDDKVVTSTLEVDKINGDVISASQVNLAELKFNDAADELTSIGQLKNVKPAKVNGATNTVDIGATGETGTIYELEFDLTSLVPTLNNGHLHVTSISCTGGTDLEHFYKLLPERCEPISRTLHVRYRWYKTHASGSGTVINPDPDDDTLGPTGDTVFDISYMVFSND